MLGTLPSGGGRAAGHAAWGIRQHLTSRERHGAGGAGCVYGENVENLNTQNEPIAGVFDE